MKENTIEKLNAYVEKASNERRIERIYCNTLDYIFVTEEDGWISIIQDDRNSGYHPIIQAKDRDKALDYIAFIEPVTVPMNIL